MTTTTLELAEAPEVEALPQHHILVGLRTLATMDEAEYNRRKEEMQRGMSRLQDVIRSILEEGQDYGHVPGIDRPFLFQSGAEKLANFFGLAVRQEAERINRKIDEPDAIPPYAFHVRSYVHLGSFDGPIVAQGYGEANPYEERYRYRKAKPKCPSCGREGLIRGRPDGKLQGKWWCPRREGGCGHTFSPEAIEATQKVENPDLWGLAETILQMAAKRSLVAAIRRATGTSGIFTQDPDSPSVEAQALEVPLQVEAQVEEPAEEVPQTEEPAKLEDDEEHQKRVALIRKVAKAKSLGPDEIASVATRVTGIHFDLSALPDRRAKGEVLMAGLLALDDESLDALAVALETGVVPES